MIIGRQQFDLGEKMTRTDTPVGRPIVEEEELRVLTQRYGEPLRRSFSLPVDESIRRFRFSPESDRRAEVVFAIQDPAGGIWVHAKRNYPRNLFRLPSGGIDWSEEVESALLREISEETALEVHVERFLGLLAYEFRDEGRSASFASYVFLVHSRGGIPRPQPAEAITEFRQVLPGQLLEIAADLRNLLGDRHAWGLWRALAHELVYDSLTTGHR